MKRELDANLRFGFLVHDVSRLRRIVVDRALKPVGLTRAQWMLLVFLSRRDGMSQTALAADLDLTKVAIGALLDRMESSGLVERRPDQRDGRVKRVHLTSKGLKFISKIREQAERVEEDLLADVPVEEIEAIAETLFKIKRKLIAMIDDAEP